MREEGQLMEDVEQKRAEAFFDALDIAPAVRSEMLLGHRNSYKSLVATLRRIAKKRGVDLPRIRANANSSPKAAKKTKAEEVTTCPHCSIECVIKGSDLVEKMTGDVHFVGDSRCQEVAEKGLDAVKEDDSKSLTFRFREAVARVRERLGIVKLSIGFRNDKVKELARAFLERFEGDLDPYVEALVKASLKRKKAKKKISIAKADVETLKKAVIGAEFEDAMSRARPEADGEMTVLSETVGEPITEPFLDEGEATPEEAPSPPQSPGETSSPPDPTSESSPPSDASQGEEGPPPDVPGQGTLFDPASPPPGPPSDEVESGGNRPPDVPEKAPQRPGDASSPPDPTSESPEAPESSQGEPDPEAGNPPEEVGNEGEEAPEKAPAEAKAGTGKGKKKAGKRKAGAKGKKDVAEYGEVEVEGQVIRVARDAKDIVAGVFDSDFFEVVKLAVALAVKNHPALPDVITDKDISEAWVQYATAKMKAKSEATIAEEKKAHTPDSQDPNREYFSVSSINQFIRCPYQWYRRRVLKEIEPPSIALAFGSSFDSAANLNYEEKIKTQKDEPDDVLHDKFVEELEGRKGEIWYDDNPKKVIEDSKAKGTKLISKFKADVMVDVYPQEVQEKITTPLDGVDYDLFSILDLTTVDGKVVDNKTSARQWHDGKERQELQRTMYALAYLAKYGTLPKAMEFHIAIKTKEPKTQVVTGVVSNEEIQGFLKFVAFVVSNIRASVKSGVFIPRRDHNLCSVRHCGYFASCEKEWGWKIYEPKKKK
jgi:hypothetical protein